MNQLRAGAILNYIIIGLNALVGLLYTPYMLRTLGQSEYGIYSLAGSVVAYLTLLDLGFGNAVVRFTSKYRANNDKEGMTRLLSLFLMLYSMIGLVVLLAGGILYANLDAMFGTSLTPTELSRVRVVVALMIFNLAVTFPLSISGAVITAHERFVFLRAIQIGRIVLNTLTMVLLLSLGYKAIAMVVAQTCFNLVTLLINFFYSRKNLQVKIAYSKFFDAMLIKEISYYSFWIFLNAIMDKVYWSTGTFVLGIFRGTAEIAVFAIAMQLVSMFMLFSTGVSGVLLPKLTIMNEKHSSDREVSDLFIRTGRLQFYIVFLVLSGFVLFGKPFILIWAGNDYASSYSITLMLFAALSIPLIQNTGIIILQARNQMRFRSLAYITIAIVTLALQIFLSKKYGGEGCAFAVTLALLLGQGLVMNIYYQKKQHLDVWKFWKEIIKISIMPVLLSAGFFLFLRYYEVQGFVPLLTCIMLFVVFYCLCAYFFSMDKYEKSIINSFLRFAHI